LTNLQFFRGCLVNEYQATKALIAAMPDQQLGYLPHPINRSAQERAAHLIACVYETIL